MSIATVASAQLAAATVALLTLSQALVAPQVLTMGYADSAPEGSSAPRAGRAT